MNYGEEPKILVNQRDDMSERRAALAWALGSAICSGLGSGATLALLVLAEWYADIARGSAGLGMIWGCGHGCLAALFCVLGIGSGIVALLTLDRAAVSGRRMAWVGIGLGCLPLLLSVIGLLLSKSDFLRG